MHRARPTPSKLSAMEKKIPTNPKYEKVQSKVNSGSTVDKLKLISNKEYLQRRDETFLRITSKNLNDLFQEYEREQTISGPEMEAKMVRKEDGTYEMKRQLVEESNQSGPRIVSYEADDNVEDNAPYLIVDTRDPDRFRVNRIHKAVNFPASHLSRDRLTAKLHLFKNKENALIVLYDDEEKEVKQAASSFVEKGFDNIYILNGGLEQFASEFPDAVEGILPPPKKKTQEKRQGTRSVHRPSQALSSTASGSVYGGEGGKAATTKRRGSKSSDVESMADSLASHLTVAESVISQATARKQRYGGASFAR